MSSLCEEAKSNAAVVVTGGSSGDGKSFIKLMSKLSVELSYCNFCCQNRANKNMVKIVSQSSSACSGVEQTTGRGGGVEGFLHRVVSMARELFINQDAIDSSGRFTEFNLAGRPKMLAVNESDGWQAILGLAAARSGRSQSKRVER